MRKKYNSFQEIEKDLKILKLKKEIAVWTMKNDYERLQSNLAPRKIAGNVLNSLINTTATAGINWKKAIGSIIVGYLIKRIIKR